MSRNMMSEEAFNELIDNLEYVENLTKYGRKNIKYHVQKLQRENEQLNGAMQTYSILLKSNIEVNKQLKEKIDKYENPKDMTLFAMWCTEKVKDENKRLKDNWNKLRKQEINRFNKTQDVQFLDVLQDMQELEQGSDSNE